VTKIEDPFSNLVKRRLPTKFCISLLVLYLMLEQFTNFYSEA